MRSRDANFTATALLEAELRQADVSLEMQPQFCILRYHQVSSSSERPNHNTLNTKPPLDLEHHINLYKPTTVFPSPHPARIMRPAVVM